MSYLIWLSIFVWFPIILLWIFDSQLLWKYKKTLLHIIFFCLVFFIPADFFATSIKVWVFQKESNLGISIGILPLEEFLFAVSAALLTAFLTIVAKYRLK